MADSRRILVAEKDCVEYTGRVRESKLVLPFDEDVRSVWIHSALIGQFFGKAIRCLIRLLMRRCVDV